VAHLNGEKSIQNPEKANLSEKKDIFYSKYDFAHIVGQNQAKRALEIAAA